MATISEEFSGRATHLDYLRESVEVRYKVFNATDENDAKAALIAQAPATWTGQKGTLRPTNYDVQEIYSKKGFLVGVITYSLPDWVKTTGETVLTFDTTGGTQHIIHSKGTTGYPTNAINMNGLIGNTGNSIEGVTITVPAFAFTVTKFFAAGSVTQSFIAGLYNLTGQVNNASWNPTVDGLSILFARDEVLFLGASGSKRPIGDVEIAEHFAGSPNVTNLTVGTVTGITKNGWDYLWVRAHQKDGGTGSNAVVAYDSQFVYIETVYDEGDFTNTGI